MKSYQYIARDSSGVRKQGTSQATNTNDVMGWLRDQGFTPVSISEMAPVVEEAEPQRSRKKIKSGDLAALCWQLNTMVEGGIPVTTALDTIAEDIENAQLQQILATVSEKMKKGETFSGSVAEYPRIFNKLSCAMILAGETSGTLVATLRRLAEYFDSRDKLAKKVKGAMVYPIFVISFIILIVVFIMAFIISRFRTIFDQIGGELPAFTQGFMTFYDFLSANLLYIIGSIVVIVTSSVFASKTKGGHRFFGKLFLAMPLFGKVFSNAFIAMFCKTMGTLLAAGVSVLETFDILSTMTNNDIMKNAITQTRGQIVEGSNISLSMRKAGFFPNMVVKMTQVGEESGSLSKILEKTADYYERKVDTTITAMLSMLEPIMIVTIGTIVMIIVLALYLPIFTMSEA